AYEVAFRELDEDLIARVTAKVAQVADLLCPRTVIPLHHGGRKHATTVSARLIDLQTREPRKKAVLRALRTSLGRADARFVALVVDLRATRLTDGLHTVTP